MAVADDQAHTGALGGGDHLPAFRQGDRHRLFHQHVLAVRGGHCYVRRMMLVRRGDVDHFDVGIRAQRLDPIVGASAEFRGKTSGRLRPRIGGGNQFDAPIGQKRRQHQRKSPAQSRNAHPQPALTHVARLR